MMEFEEVFSNTFQLGGTKRSKPEPMETAMEQWGTPPKGKGKGAKGKGSSKGHQPRVTSHGTAGLRSRWDHRLDRTQSFMLRAATTPRRNGVPATRCLGDRTTATILISRSCTIEWTP